MEMENICSGHSWLGKTESFKNETMTDHHECAQESENVHLYQLQHLLYDLKVLNHSVLKKFKSIKILILMALNLCYED